MSALDDTASQEATNVVSGDSGPGTGLMDLLPLPSDTKPVTDPLHTATADSLAGEASLSHALATGNHETRGQAQTDHDEDEVLNLGWNEDKEHIAQPLVGGMDNEDLWMLVRRFDKQMYHVKAVPYPVPGNLDLNIADEEEFSPDKLRANLERLYTTIIVGLLNVVKHIARLRSWRETRRTGVACGVYFVAWVLDFLIPLMSVTILVLIVYPPSRAFMFPPAPIALVDSKTGGVQKPKSGVLGSLDSATGAPENHRGEAVEQEASNFVNGIASVALSSATGKHPQSEGSYDGADDSEDDNGQSAGAPIDAAPDPAAFAMSAANAKDVAKGQKSHAKHDKTKVPMETAMWTKMRPIMHGIADLTDTWERFGNALSPTPPFPKETYRLRIAVLVIPLVAISLFVSSYMFIKGVTFGVGFGFFGDPIISRGLAWLNRTIPNWQKMLELRNTVLKGVPTNAQLTITLLRIGEANKAPLPPPPRATEAPPDEPADVTDEHLRSTGAEPPLNATDAELDAAMAHDPTTKHETSGPDIDAAKDAKHGKKGSKILNFFRGTTKGGVKTAMGTDTLRAKLGSKHAKDRLGAAPPPPTDRVSGPVEFKCRHKGTRGHCYISTASTIPAVAFASSSETKTVTVGDGDEKREELHAKWSVAVADIVELRKIGGYGWKAKLVVGWALGREVADGLEIVTATGEAHRITACPLRDELFNRLVAMGGQKWEAW